MLEFLIEYLPFVVVGLLASIALVMWLCKAKRYIGLTYMCLGVAMLVLLHIYGLTFSNRLLLIPLALILLGFVIHVWVQKKESRY